MVCTLHLVKTFFYLWIVFSRVTFSFSFLCVVELAFSSGLEVSSGIRCIVFLLNEREMRNGYHLAFILNSQGNGFMDPL